MLHKIMFMKCL